MKFCKKVYDFIHQETIKLASFSLQSGRNKVIEDRN